MRIHKGKNNSISSYREEDNGIENFHPFYVQSSLGRKYYYLLVDINEKENRTNVIFENSMAPESNMRASKEERKRFERYVKAYELMNR